MKETNGVKTEGAKPRRSARHASQEVTRTLPPCVPITPPWLSERAGGRRSSNANDANGAENGKKKKDAKDEVCLALVTPE